MVLHYYKKKTLCSHLLRFYIKTANKLYLYVFFSFRGQGERFLSSVQKLHLVYNGNLFITHTPI